MALTTYTQSEIAAQTLAFLRVRFPNRDTGTGSFLDKISQTFAMQVMLLQKAMVSVDNDATPQAKTSSIALDGWAFVFGVPSDTPGVYGRKKATAASGGTATLSGTRGTVYPNALVATAPDGVTQVQLSGGVTIPGIPPGSDVVAASIIGLTPGAASNILIGTTLTWQTPPSGADPTFVLTAGLSGGSDVESDSDLLTRLLLRLQNPPKGGTSSDYRGWAESRSGVVRGFPYPLRHGLGTVDLVITQAIPENPFPNTGRAATAGQVTDVFDYIDGTSTEEGQRTVTQNGFNVYAPHMGTNERLDIKQRVVPFAKYAFDWVCGTTIYSVAAFTPVAGPGSTLTLNTPAPADLIAAITAGSNPRIQVASTGGTVVPSMVRVTAIDVTNLILTLDELPANWVDPTVTDRVFSGGPIPQIVAQALLDYVNTLGPARGTYAPSTDFWEDTCEIARLDQIALNQVDNDGVTVFIRNVVASGLTTTINGSAVDVEALDNYPTFPPAMLWARSIVVTD